MSGETTFVKIFRSFLALCFPPGCTALVLRKVFTGWSVSGMSIAVEFENDERILSFRGRSQSRSFGVFAITMEEAE
jgi:hypothetical protein